MPPAKASSRHAMRLPVAAMPVRQAYPSRRLGAHPSCCHRNQPASGSAPPIASRPLRVPRPGSQRRHTPWRFRSTRPMPIASHRRAQGCSPALPSQCAKVTAGGYPIRRTDVTVTGRAGSEHGDAAPFRPRGGSDGRASWLPRQMPSSLRSHRGVGEALRAARRCRHRYQRSANPCCPVAALGLGNSAGGCEAPAASFEPPGETPGRSDFASVMAGLGVRGPLPNGQTAKRTAPAGQNSAERLMITIY
jgi:hypothetical protein